MSFQRTPFSSAWMNIFSSTEPATAERLRAMFPCREGGYDEWQFSKLHKIILGLDSSDLGNYLAHYPSETNVTDCTGRSTLFWAARRGDDVAVELLLKANANANLVANTGETVLYSALRSGSIACTKLILAAMTGVHYDERSPFSALHGAARYIDEEALIKSLVKAGLDPNIPDDYGSCPIFSTMVNDNSIAAATLLDLGADIDSQDDDGDTPLMEALFRHADTVTQLLLQRGAKYSSIYSTGDSILHLAAKSGGIRTLDMLMTAELKGIDPYYLNREGKTATRVAQERLGKPVGFVEKMHELIIGIDTRNLRLTQGQKRDNNERVTNAETQSRAFKIMAKGFSILRDFTKTSTLYHTMITIKPRIDKLPIWNAASRQTSCIQSARQMQMWHHPFPTLCLGIAIGIITICLIHNWNNASNTALETHQARHVIYLGDSTMGHEL